MHVFIFLKCGLTILVITKCMNIHSTSHIKINDCYNSPVSSNNRNLFTLNLNINMP